MVDARVIEVDLHQLVMVGFTILVDVASMFHPLYTLCERPGGKLHHCIRYILKQQNDHLILGQANVQT
jgi:hypothetical protein